MRPARRPGTWDRRHCDVRAVVRTAVAVQGAALAVLVGSDGSPGWRAARAVAAIAGTALVLRLGGRWSALAVGAVAVAVGGAIGPRWLAEAGPTLTGLAGVVELVAGLVLIGAVLTTVGQRAHGWRRLPAVGLPLVAVVVAAWTLFPAVMVTNVPPLAAGTRTPGDVGLTYAPAAFTTADGVRLAGWYVPSANGAAVVLRHGAGSTKDRELDHAAVLAHHGYGVLLVDARGHGDSGGRAMDFGWYGDADIAAAVGHLAARPGVDPRRIAVVGMSMGGEEAIGAAASDHRIAAVVAEGVTGRTDDDKAWLSDEYGGRGWLQERLEWAQYAATDLLTEAGEPVPLAAAVAAAAPRPFLVIAAGDVPTEVHVAARLAAAAPGTVTTWTVPGAGHTGGLATRPADWERRVTTFLDHALRAPQSGKG